MSETPSKKQRGNQEASGGLSPMQSRHFWPASSTWRCARAVAKSIALPTGHVDPVELRQAVVALCVHAVRRQANDLRVLRDRQVSRQVARADRAGELHHRRLPGARIYTHVTAAFLPIRFPPSAQQRPRGIQETRYRRQKRTPGGTDRLGRNRGSTRNVRSLSSWRDPASILEACAAQYREDLWESQSVRPEVWIEKDAPPCASKAPARTFAFRILHAAATILRASNTRRASVSRSISPTA